MVQTRKSKKIIESDSSDDFRIDISQQVSGSKKQKCDDDMSLSVSNADEPSVSAGLDPFLDQLTLPPLHSHTDFLNQKDFIFHSTLTSLQQEDLVAIYRKFPMLKTERDLINDYALQAAKLTCAFENNRAKLESYVADYEADIIPKRFKTKLSGIMDKFKAEEIIAHTNRELFKSEMERIFATAVTQNRKFAELYHTLFSMIAKIIQQQLIRISNLDGLELDHPITPNANLDEAYIKFVLAAYCDLNPRCSLFLDSFNNHMAFFSAKRFKHLELAKNKAEKKLAKKEAHQEAKLNRANTLFAGSNAVSVEDKINLLANEIKTLTINSGRGRKPAASSSSKPKGQKPVNSGKKNGPQKKQKTPENLKEGAKKSSEKKRKGNLKV